MILVLVGCGSDPDPQDAGCLTCRPDTGPTIRDAGFDAGFDAGPALGDACEWNYDCAEGQRCVGSDDAGTRTCQIGMRGVLPVGQPCSVDGQCESGVCFTENETTACTAPCATLSGLAEECDGVFPACRDIPFFGRICALAE